MLGLEALLTFERSHWFFPTLILGLIGFVLIVLAVQKLLNRKSLNSKGDLKTEKGNSETSSWSRLALMLLLLVSYFWLMAKVGNWYPNMGLGFLAASIPCLWLFSLFYVPNFHRRTLVAVSINACVAPLAVWLVLGQLMNLSLP